MTLKISIAHASPGYPASAMVAKSGGYSALAATDGGTAVERYIHSGSSAVVHELGSNETLEHAEERALIRMWGAYANTAGGKTFDGKPLPTWAELGEERQSCWRAALRAL